MIVVVMVIGVCMVIGIRIVIVIVNFQIKILGLPCFSLLNVAAPFTSSSVLMWLILLCYHYSCFSSVLGAIVLLFFITFIMIIAIGMSHN